MSPFDLLLVDDQATIAAAVRLMLDGAEDVRFHACRDPAQALATAERIRPAVILQDLVMPDVDGLELLERYRASPTLREVPVIVLSSSEDAETKARSFGLGANDYIVKLPHVVEFLARIRHHAAGYRAQVERNEAYAELQAARARLADELASAGRYARGLLPPPMEGEVTTDWLFEPSEDLGGDMLGHYLLPDGRVVLYVLDVAGHGVGSALHGMAIATVLRSHAQRDTDFGEPARVLQTLNRSFPMDRYDGLFSTLWYGVYDPVTRRLTYAVGGHPPALLVGKDGGVTELAAEGTLIGIDPDCAFEQRTISVAPGDRLYVFSDGASEIELEDGSILDDAAFRTLLLSHETSVAGYHAACRALRGGKALEDDCSVLLVRFGGEAA